MSTRSLIGMETEDGIKSIYCHYDGYPLGVGYRLKHHWQDREQVAELLALGDILSLGLTIGEKHDCDRDWELANKNGWTRVYHRDRGEECVTVCPESYPDREVFLADAKDRWTEWIYLLTSDGWLCSTSGGGLLGIKYNEHQDGWVPLEIMLAAETKMQEEK